MELHPLQNAPRLRRCVSLIEGSSGVGIQIILHDAHIFGVRIDGIDQPLDAVRVVELGAVLRHLDMSPARERLDKEKQIGGTQTFILVINALCLSWLYWLSRPHIGLRGDEFFVEADGWITGVVLFFIQAQDILHRRHELCSYGWDAPLLVLPGFQFIFLSNWRMVSGEMDSTKPNSTALPANKRTVQWS